MQAHRGALMLREQVGGGMQRCRRSRAFSSRCRTLRPGLWPAAGSGTGGRWCRRGSSRCTAALTASSAATMGSGNTLGSTWPCLLVMQGLLCTPDQATGAPKADRLPSNGDRCNHVRSYRHRSRGSMFPGISGYRCNACTDKERECLIEVCSR